MVAKHDFLLQGIPPKGRKPNKYRDNIAKTNDIVAEQLKSYKNCHYFHVDPYLFIDKNTGLIDRADLFDYLHHTNEGGEKLYAPMLPLIEKLAKQEHSEEHSKWFWLTLTSLT